MLKIFFLAPSNQDVDEYYLPTFCKVVQWVSEWLLFNTNSAIFQLYQIKFQWDDGEGSTWREPLNMGKQLVNFITCGCELSALFFVIYKAGREPTLYWW
jgi:hypothetical protein